ncbi:hypothetical protein QTG56_25150 (plasmid) [Rossellomorea sp. AcN35-11]|nr:hypothetical protein [Rossellomorea aquimaris]WJV31922.1 hypothetical protein QTG56_25150 [Rossellomorea sp. AcN35-11]
MDKQLPNNIIQIEQLKINRNLNKLCSCNNRRFTLDTQNRRVLCDVCGAVVDPYDAMYDLASKRVDLQREVETLLQQRMEIAEYKPWLKVIKSLEKHYRGKHYLPNCPRCAEPFYLEELSHWTGREYAEARIEKWKENNALENEK